MNNDQLTPKTKSDLAVAAKPHPPARRTRKRGTATLKPDVAVETEVKAPGVLASQARDRANRQIANAATAYSKAMNNGVPKLLGYMDQVDAMVAEQLCGAWDEAYGETEATYADGVELIEEA